MKKIIIDPEFWELFPDGQINILMLNQLDNHSNIQDETKFQGLLDEAVEQSKQYLKEETFRFNPVIDQWRKALQQFKTKKGARSSIEALLKRVDQGKSLTPINPLVDIYNSISLKFASPCGGEDLDKIVGDLHLGTAKGGESFYPLGETEDNPALPDEVIYYDEKGAICRSMNWREAQRTMLTNDTTNAVLVIEAINQEQVDRSDQAIKELHKLCLDNFQVKGEVMKLTRDQTEQVIVH
ncbi:B3/B4 domain-containing protein [Companilactobacillus furfuricola]|uniref:B3/B4 domain-containing protein n=1 Tax=Companilactobacillus furfuricola TaxID=1462575 RepID=UPI000F797DF8|nr:phenylalanine--tRNA ligase beta subunit-related protein [Companilactobacillus furfuricola]